MEASMSLETRGPIAWRNWRAFINGDPSRTGFEATCYTDAYVSEWVDSGLGPYRILNTFAEQGHVGEARPRIVLRIQVHLEDQAPTSSELKVTEVSGYHGGGLDDEIASLLSLAL